MATADNIIEIPADRTWPLHQPNRPAGGCIARASCLSFAYFLPHPSAAWPSRCPGSVGHSYALLRQQAKLRGEKGIRTVTQAATRTWKEHNHKRKEVPRAVLGNAYPERGPPPNRAAGGR